ncbi:MAG: hypothetical protein RQ826_12850 [Xanthomonadales bacterium]|nr:hypothetical protein [Xanthomonadales bacterium]
MFWPIAAAALLVAVFITLRPLMRGPSAWKPVALALLFALPALGIWMYRDLVGTPQALDAHPVAPMAVTDASDIDAMIDSLRGRLTETEADLDGWLLLSRTLKTMQRFPQALEAVETARKIAPDNPRVLVELAEARIFISRDGRIGDEEIALLQRALELDPHSQKGLWLMGIASLQAGDPETAIAYWESLMGQLEPGSEITQSVQAQINEAKAQIGVEVGSVESPPAPTTPTAAAGGLQVSIAAAEEAAGSIPTGGVLYVMIRAPGPAMGPPLGVRRIEDPVLPLQLTITDNDSMLKERLISSEEEVQVQARISQSGSPAALPGDWQSSAQTVSLSAGTPVQLLLDQQVR